MTTTAKPLSPQTVAEPGLLESWRNTLSNALIITRREVRDSFRDWRILAPIVILTFFFPFLAEFIAGRFANFVEGYGAARIGDRTIPFLLMIVGFFPISISLVIALETFVGEKERMSLEPLLSTPLTNTELYIGKTLAAMIPPLVSSYGGMAVYMITLLFGELTWRPPPLLIVQIVLLTTVQALVMVTGAVVVSSQTTSTRAANLLASFIIIPMTLIIQGESAIMFLAPDAESARGIGALWVIIGGMLVVVALLLRVGNAIFNREELLGRTLDRLNIRGMFSKIWRYARAVDDEGTPAKNIFDWYRRSLPLTFSRLRGAIIVTVIVFVAAFIVGVVIGNMEQWQLKLPPQNDFVQEAERLGSYLNPALQREAMGFIIWQNGRVLLAAFILAIFTFGVGALVIAPATFAILGYLFSQMVIAGYNPLFMLSAVLTHGVVEIPVIIIAIAAALRLGAVMTRPPRGNTVGHAWTVALGDVVKLALGVIIPGLIIAAFLEAFVTPEVVLAILGR
jgi:uncharacterized membrane protein SpoIIM required for sporulation/ABC-type transport system involved in multi-copper enzyme maturation permease subunit